MVEIWKDICLVPGYEVFTNYEISSTGLVRNKLTNTLRKILISSTGYDYLQLRNSSHVKNIKIHRALAILFIDNQMDCPCVDHINGDITDNRLVNLRWVTKTQNAYNSKRRYDNTSGYKNIQASEHKSKPVWRIRITVDGKKHHKRIKRNTEEVPQQVIECRDQMLKDLHKEFASFRI
jgi:hypothetical protein